MFTQGVLFSAMPLFYWLWGEQHLHLRNLVPPKVVHLRPNDRHMLGHGGKKG